jgi:hypothetical protein
MDVGVPGKVESVGALILLGLVLELPELGSLGLAFVPGTVVPEGVVSVPEGVVPEGVVPEGVVPEGVVPEGMLVLSGVVVPDGVVVSAPEGFVMLVPLVGFFLPLAAGVVVFFFLVVWAVFPAKVET